MSFRRLSIYAGAVLIIVLAILFYIKTSPYMGGTAPTSSMGDSQQVVDELRGLAVPFKVAVVSADLGESVATLPAEFIQVSRDELLAGKAAGADVVWFVGQPGADMLAGDQVFASMMRQLVMGGQPMVVVDLPKGYDLQSLRHAFGLSEEQAAVAVEDPYLVYFVGVQSDSGGEVQSGALSLPSNMSTSDRFTRAVIKSYELLK